MKKLILSVIAVLAIAFSANAANYKVDNNAIDNIIENATEIVSLEVAPAATAAANVAEVSEVKAVTAFILNFFLGGFGIHRHYMGTAPFMWALYTFTFAGIFGIVPTVDLVVLLIALIDGSSIGKYCGNTKFFVWA